jgi:hypothetical protein
MMGRSMKIVHGMIQTARGHLTDEDYLACEEVLGRAVDVAKDIEAERDHLAAEIDVLTQPDRKGGGQ